MRVYVSSTSADLAEHRAKTREAILALGHHPIGMESYPAEDKPPLARCLEDVASCNAYVGIFAWRYGSRPPEPHHGMSYTEWEYRCARDRRVTVYAFLLSESTPWPATYRDTGPDGEAVARLREDVQRGRLVSFFTNPDDLAAKVSQALPRGGWIGQRVVGLNFAAPRGFRNRDQPLDDLRARLGDRHHRLVCILGAPGIGKTRLLARAAADIEEAAGPPTGVDGMIYVGCDRDHPPTLADLFYRFGQMLGPPHDEDLRDWLRDASLSAAEKSRRLLAKLGRGCYLLLFDRLEELLSPGSREIADPELRSFIETCLVEDHCLQTAVTSRTPVGLGERLEAEVGRARVELLLEEGLPDDDAVDLLRERIAAGRRTNPSLLSASEQTLRRIVGRCGGIPGSLCRFVLSLEQHPTTDCARALTDDELMARATHEGAREVYESLGPAQQQVLQALAGFGGPVQLPALRAVLPWLADGLEGLLDDLVYALLVTYDGQCLSLPSRDRPYCYAQMPARQPWTQRLTSAGRRTLTGQRFHAAAARHFRAAAPPLDQARTREDLLPYIEAVNHLIRAGKHDAAYLLANSFMPRYLWPWGHSEECARLYQTLQGHLTNPIYRHLNGGNLGLAYWSIGRADDALPLLRKALRQVERLWLLWPQASAWSYSLAVVLFTLGELGEAQGLFARALQLDRRTRDRRAECIHLCGLGILHRAQGKLDDADQCSNRALELSRRLADPGIDSMHHACLGRTAQLRGDLEAAVNHHTAGLQAGEEARVSEGRFYNQLGLAWNALLSGDPVRALGHSQDALSLDYVRSRHQAALVLGLAYAGASTSEAGRPALEECLGRCDVLLSWTPRNFVALYFRAAALLALGQREEAQSAYARALGACDAAGVRMEASEAVRLVGRYLPGTPGVDEAQRTLARDGVGQGECV